MTSCFLQAELPPPWTPTARLPLDQHSPTRSCLCALLQDLSGFCQTQSCQDLRGSVRRPSNSHGGRHRCRRSSRTPELDLLPADVVNLPKSLHQGEQEAAGMDPVLDLVDGLHGLRHAEQGAGHHRPRRGRRLRSLCHPEAGRPGDHIPASEFKCKQQSGKKSLLKKRNQFKSFSFRQNTNTGLVLQG